MPVNIPAEALDEYGDALSVLVHVLDAVEQEYQQAGVELPDRRFYTVGDVSSVAFDCEQVTVNLVRIYPGQPGAQNGTPQSCGIPWSAQIAVQVVRCVPVGKPSAQSRKSAAPPVAAIIAAARVQAVDMGILSAAASSMANPQNITASVDAGGAEGGLQAVILTVDIALQWE